LTRHSASCGSCGERVEDVVDPRAWFEVHKRVCSRRLNTPAAAAVAPAVSTRQKEATLPRVMPKKRQPELAPGTKAAAICGHCAARSLWPVDDPRGWFVEHIVKCPEGPRDLEHLDARIVEEQARGFEHAGRDVRSFQLLSRRELMRARFPRIPRSTAELKEQQR